MPSTPGCLDADVLERLQRGEVTIDDVATLGEHLIQCRRCAEAAGALSGDDPLTAAVRAGAVPADDADRTRIHGLIERLRGLATLSPKGTGADRPAYDFLAPPRQPDEIGRLGPYRVLSVLGSGGMGVVFQAEDKQLRRPVALKVMRPALVANPSARQRFLREAQTAAALEHEHIVTIFQVGEDRGVPFLAMPLLTGETLEDRLRRDGVLPVAEVLRIGREMAEGLAAAHEHGLIHRDIKPANVWLEGERGLVKLLDFGLARLVADDAHLTQEGHVAGTPHYMAPEQAEGKPVDHRGDLFGLGCVLYRMATGRLPFPGANSLTVLRAVALQQPKPPRAINPTVPRALSDLTMKLLAKEPEGRPSSAAAVVEALAALERGATASRPRRHRLLAVAAALLFLGVLAGLATIFLRTPDGTLVVEIDDPQVKVTIEGDGGLVITGAGPREVRLRPGSYRLRASKDGKPVPVDRELVTISRGDKQVVKVSLERRHEVPAGTEIRRFLGHTDSIWRLVFSPDGRRFLSAGFDGTVRVWDVETGQEQRRFEGHKGCVWSVALSPDGRYALSGSGGGAPDVAGDPVAAWSVCLWEVETGKELHRTEGRAWAITSVAFSPDGRQALFGNYDGTVRLWDIDEWKEIRRFDHMKGLWCVCFSPDGRKALTSGSWEGGLARLWDLESGKELRQFDGPPYGFFHVVFSPGGRFFLTAGVQDDNVRLWDVETGEVIRRFSHKGGVMGVAFSPDGRYAVSGGLDRTVRLWHVATGEERLRMEGHRHPIPTVIFSPDGRQVLSGSKDRTIRLWRLPEPERGPGD